MASQNGRHALPDPVAAAAVFVSSGAVLVLEVTGLRLVGPYLWVTLETSSAVIGIAAIAYGAWTGGWLADRTDPRRLIGPIFLFAAAATAVTLPLVRWAGEYLRGTAGGGALAPTALATGFILVAALPTSAILLGLTVTLALAETGLLAYLWQVDRGGRDRRGQNDRRQNDRSQNDRGPDERGSLLRRRDRAVAGRSTQTQPQGSSPPTLRCPWMRCAPALPPSPAR